MLSSSSNESVPGNGLVQNHLFKCPLLFIFTHGNKEAPAEDKGVSDTMDKSKSVYTFQFLNQL